MNFTPDGPVAIPLWINGHAYLTVTEHFFDVIDPLTGEAIRRVPLSGADEAAEAVGAAAAARAGWSALAAGERRTLLQALAKALDDYTGHFAKLIRQETGRDEADCLAEVAAAVAALREPAAGQGQLVAVLADAGRPLAALVELAAPVLAAGGTVVFKPSPKAPGAAYAFSELTARAGLPGGVVNLVQGDEAAVEGLCAQTAVDCVAYAGDAALGARVAAIAASHGRAFRAA